LSSLSRSSQRSGVIRDLMSAKRRGEPCTPIAAVQSNRWAPPEAAPRH
jgi:hypothetical protein